MHSGIIKGNVKAHPMEEKDIAFLRLWDLYNGILTDNQREITNLYFNYDLSLGEIAEQKGVSRQSVSDCLKKCKKQLEGLEEKLKFTQALDEVCLDYSAYMTKVNRWAEEQLKKHPEWSEELSVLQAITGSDTEEIIKIEE